MKTQKTSQRRKLNILLSLVFIAVLFTALAGGVVAKYVQNSSKGGSVSASEFYFESDLLKENGKSYTLNAGTTSVSFEMRNFADALRYSEMDITYEITQTGGLTLSYQGDKKLEKNVKSSEIVTLQGFENGKTYTVTAVGKGGYKQTLSATFTVRTDDTGFYKYTQIKPDGSVKLTVWTSNLFGSVLVEIPASLIPDRRNPLLENAGNTVSFTLEKRSSIVLDFFIPNDYTGDRNFAFLVKLNGSVNALETLPSN